GLYLSAIDPVETAILVGLIPDAASATTDILNTVQQMLARGEILPEKLAHTFRFEYLTDSSNFIPGALLHSGTAAAIGGVSIRTIAFWLLFAGFAVKLPIVPVHTWLPDAHVEA